MSASPARTSATRFASSSATASPTPTRTSSCGARAYGRDFTVPALLAAEYDRAEQACLRNGWHRQLARLPTERAWLAANRGLF